MSKNDDDEAVHVDGSVHAHGLKFCKVKSGQCIEVLCTGSLQVVSSEISGWDCVKELVWNRCFIF